MSAALAELIHSGRVWRGHERARVAAEPSGHAALDAQLPGGGWPVGGLCEIVHAQAGVGELSLVLPLLARLTRAKRPVVFIAPPHRPYAPALRRAGVETAHILVAEAPEPDIPWCAEQALRARAGAVLLWPRRADTQALRRLQLAAEDARSIVFLMHSGKLRSFSPAALRLRLQREQGAPRVDIEKCRGGAIGQSLRFG